MIKKGGKEMKKLNLDEIKTVPSDTLLDEVIHYAENHLNQNETEYWESITNEIFRRLDKYDEMNF